MSLKSYFYFCLIFKTERIIKTSYLLFNTEPWARQASCQGKRKENVLSTGPSLENRLILKSCTADGISGQKVVRRRPY